MFRYKHLFHLIIVLKLSLELALCSSTTRSRSDGDVSTEDGNGKTTEIALITDKDQIDLLDTLYTEKSTTKLNEIDTTQNYESDVASILCPHFKNSSKFNIDQMIDVWQTIYYQVPHKVPCFKILIRKVTSEEKNRYSQLYGDFSEKVLWEDCNLEVKSSAGRAARKHFLQGSEKGSGVLENIIIEQEDNNTVVNLHEESPDQWKVVKNLLLMRDCENGEMVVFSRVPHQPKLDEVLSAIEDFGKVNDGEWACNDARDKTDKRQAFDGDFEAYSDVVFFE